MESVISEPTIVVLVITVPGMAITWKVMKIHQDTIISLSFP